MDSVMPFLVKLKDAVLHSGAISYQTARFLLFSVVVLIFYYLVGKRGQKYVMLVASLFFYAVAGTRYLPYLLTTLAVTYLGGLWIRHFYKKEAAALEKCEDVAAKKAVRAASKRKAKAVLIVTMLIPVVILAVSKYTDFAMTNINRLLKALDMQPVTIFRTVVPLGISFYTFMAVSYILDVFWKRYEAETHPIRYAAWLTWFPHIVQGPIDRYNHFKDQTLGGVKFSTQNLAYGAELVIWGFFKKLVIADRLGLFVNEIYNNWQEYTGILFVIATVLYSVQIYADFSGCIDIVSGVSEMFGVKLAQNFNHPYFSKTMPEFWRRWHMSLGEWFKDYIYYPVSTSALVKSVKKRTKQKGRKRVGELFASCFSAFVVWVITGIWHGAAWTFVAWGMFHAVLIIGSNLFTDFNDNLSKRLHIRTETFSWKLWQMTRTFILCGIGRMLFLSKSLSQAFHIIKSSFTSVGIGQILENKIYTYGLDRSNFMIALIAIFALWVGDMLQDRMPVRETLAKQNVWFRFMIVLAGIFVILIFGNWGPGYDAASFIYEQF